MRKIHVNLLTDDPDKVAICTAYWEMDTDGKFIHKVSDLAEIADVRPCDIYKLTQKYSTALCEEIVCDSCQQPRHVQNRTDYLSAGPYWICTDCLEIQHDKKMKQQKKTIDKKRKSIRSVLNLNGRPLVIPIEDMTLSQAVYMLSLMRFALSEDTSLLNPIDYYKGSFAPQDSYQIKILSHLYDNDRVYVDPESDIEAFEFEDCNLKNFDLTEVSWFFPLVTLSDDTTVHPLQGITQALQKDVWPSHWTDKRLELWKEVALNETIEYLTLQLAKHELPFKVGQKTEMVISLVLNDFSVSQCYNFIWRAAKDAAAYYMRESISKQQAANSVIGNIQRSSEKAKAEGWDIKGYERNFDSPQTILSELTFNLALNIGEQGFKLPPKEEYLPSHN